MMRSSFPTLLPYGCLAGLCLLLAVGCSRPKSATPPLTAEPTAAPQAPAIQLGDAPRLPQESGQAD
jgi:hypothetical protein